MSKGDDLRDLRDQMSKLRKDREARVRRDSNTDAETKDIVDRTVALMVPIVETFVESDRALELQSSASWGFYIGYAYVKICRIVVTSSIPDHVDIRAEWNYATHQIYSGTFDEAEIKSTVKAALLNWYSTILQ